MEYRHLGKSGLRVSELSYGSWITFGESLDLQGIKACMAEAFDRGVNFFDNAEAYAGGLAELLMGEALKEYRREDVVLSTKIFWGGQGPNDRGLSRKHVVEGTRNSLKRLQVEYVDILFCHRPDPSTPIEETVRAMDFLIKEGLTFYWGTSEWSAQQIEEAYTIATQIGCVPPTAEQPEYNLFHRPRVEVEYLNLYQTHGMGATVWSPLDMGILSGKYNDGMPEQGRLTHHDELAARLTTDKVAKVRALTDIAGELGCSMAQLAVAWCLKNQNVSTVITGATSPEQVAENLASIEVKSKLTPEVMERIDNIAGTLPTTG